MKSLAECHAVKLFKDKKKLLLNRDQVLSQHGFAFKKDEKTKFKLRKNAALQFREAIENTVPCPEQKTSVLFCTT